MADLIRCKIVRLPLTVTAHTIFPGGGTFDSPRSCSKPFARKASGFSSSLVAKCGVRLVAFSPRKRPDETHAHPKDHQNPFHTRQPLWCERLPAQRGRAMEDREDPGNGSCCPHKVDQARVPLAGNRVQQGILPR